MSSAEQAEHGSVLMVNVADVEPVPINTMTVAHDQGSSRRLININTCGSPDLLVANFRMGPHQHHPRHVHANVGEVYFVLDGRCRMEVGDVAEWVESGTAIYVPRGTAHCVDTGGVGASMLIIYPQGDNTKVEKEFVEPDSELRF
jgi:mannose-6-phosphate isomerase-like protein (cupin superfamily)